jgi:carbamate kinase
MKKLAVVALGGNALLRDEQAGTIEEQEKNTFDTLENLVHLIKDGYNLVITHGNGPQVGNSLLRNDAGESVYNLPQMPLDMCVADTQGEIGYMIERIFNNVLIKHGIKKEIVSVLTQVLVKGDDPAFNNPTKRIGKAFPKKIADVYSGQKGWDFKPEQKSEGKFRRVVPSPEPVEIVNNKVVKDLVNKGHVVIAAGGGGIPVYRDEEGMLKPLEAVVDKDFASSLLAGDIDAHEFYILTDVPYVYLNFKQANQQVAEFLNYEDTLNYLQAGMFGEGNMAPKIRAALNFLEKGGEKSVITEAFKLEDKSFGTKITMTYDHLEFGRRLRPA